jgi:hypothetical protein
LTHITIYRLIAQQELMVNLFVFVQYEVKDVKIARDAGEMISVTRSKWDALVAENSALNARILQQNTKIAQQRETITYLTAELKAKNDELKSMQSGHR